LAVEGAPHQEKGRSTIPRSEFERGLEGLEQVFLLEWPHIVFQEIREDEGVELTDMFKHAWRRRPGEWPMAVLIQPGRSAPDRRPSSGPRSYGVILALAASERVVELVVWVRGAYRMIGLGDAIARTVHDFKEDLKELMADGYTLRSRYPSDDRSRGKQQWLRALRANFSQNQGFHRDDTDTAINPPDILIYRSKPR